MDFRRVVVLGVVGVRVWVGVVCGFFYGGFKFGEGVGLVFLLRVVRVVWSFICLLMCWS